VLLVLLLVLVLVLEESEGPLLGPLSPGPLLEALRSGLLLEALPSELLLEALPSELIELSVLVELSGDDKPTAADKGVTRLSLTNANGLLLPKGFPGAATAGITKAAANTTTKPRTNAILLMLFPPREGACKVLLSVPSQRRRQT
jgi:hypothetical protein